MITEIFDIITSSLPNKTETSLEDSSIISIIINDYMGGIIKRCKCGDYSYYYNVVNGKIIDLTVSIDNEYIPNYIDSNEVSREELLNNKDIRNRYRIFLNNIRNNFILNGKKEYCLRDESNEKISSKIPGTIGGYSKLKVYGRLDCPSALRWISKGKYVDKRVFFEDEETAIKAGYRPCSICMHKQYLKWKGK